MSKPVVFVIGASGNVGSATVKTLSAKHAGRVEIRAGVRNPDKADSLKSLTGVRVVKAEMGSSELETTLKGVAALFIVPPSTEDRAELSIATAASAKKAGVPHTLVVSIPPAQQRDSEFGRQFKKMETGIKALGIQHTFLRIPRFVENYFVFFKETIKNEGKMYAPIDPTKPFVSVVVADAGNAAASILVDPANHANKVYHIISDLHTYGDVAAAFEEALGKKVTYNRVSYKDTKELFVGFGLLEWQAEGVMELFHLVDRGDTGMDLITGDDYQKITGEQPTKLKAWVAQVKDAFQ